MGVSITCDNGGTGTAVCQATGTFGFLVNGVPVPSLNCCALAYVYDPVSGRCVSVDSYGLTYEVKYSNFDNAGVTDEWKVTECGKVSTTAQVDASSCSVGTLPVTGADVCPSQASELDCTAAGCCSWSVPAPCSSTPSYLTAQCPNAGLKATFYLSGLTKAQADTARLNLAGAAAIGDGDGVSSVSAEPGKGAGKKKFPYWAGIAIAAAVLLVAGKAYLWWHHAADSPKNQEKTEQESDPQNEDVEEYQEDYQEYA